MRRHKSLAQRLMNLALLSPKRSCWIFSGWRLPNGYGHMVGTGRGSGTLLAHRAAWIAFNGPIPEGMWVLHKCDVRACINPDHLFLGTAQDNSDDMKRKGRHRAISYPGEKNPHSKLTEEQARIIKSGTKSIRQYAREFGVGVSTVQQCKSGLTWKHVSL